VWGFVPGFETAHRAVALRTRDGVTLRGDLLHGPAGPCGGGPAVLLLHGFAAHRRKPAYARLATRLAQDLAVLALDLRGHGGSAGRSSLGDAEVHDVRAACAWLRRAGHDRVVLIGASMGATAAIRAAGQTPGIAAAVCSISAPAAFVGAGGAPAVAALGRMMTSPPWRWALQAALRVRVARAWGAPASSEALVGAISPVPLLLVHGADDAWFAVEHLDRLCRAAGEPTAVWREPPGFGHAEDGFSAAFADRLADAVAGVLAAGRWPALPAQRRSGPSDSSSASSASTVDASRSSPGRCSASQ
jgi:alpha-beta hydrolase superfamily lysophospholipase